MSICVSAEVDQSGYKRTFTASIGWQIDVRETPGGGIQIVEFRGDPRCPGSFKVLAHVYGQSFVTTDWGPE